MDFRVKCLIRAAFASFSGKDLPDRRTDETQRLSVASCLIIHQTREFIEMLHLGNKNFLNILPGMTSKSKLETHEPPDLTLSGGFSQYRKRLEFVSWRKPST